MATKKEIRDGIAKDIYADWAIGSVPWEKTLPAEKTPWLKTADKVMITEDSQSVVVKVERELPEYVGCVTAADKISKALAQEAQQDMLEAGYVAVEPLIGEQ